MLKKEPKRLLEQFDVAFHDKGTEWFTVECRFCNDERPNVEDCHGGIHKENGAFNCFKCGAKSNILNIIAIKYGMPVRTIEAHVDNIFGTAGDIAKDGTAIVDVCHKELLGNVEYLRKLEEKHGINIESVKKYTLGLYLNTNRITIPIRDMNGSLVNLKQYKYDAKNDKMLQPKGKVACVYLASLIPEAQEVIITEGEFKAILLNQHGFVAVAPTAGAGTWKADWNYLFKDKDVVIIYDVDEAGRKGASKLSICLYPFAKSIKNVFLRNVIDIEAGDVTDFFTRRNGNYAELRKIIDDTPVYTPAVFEPAEEDTHDDDAIPCRLAACSKAEYFGRIVKTTAVVQTKDMHPYIIPKRCSVVCNKDKEYCATCHIYTRTEKFEFDIPSHSKLIIELVHANEAKQHEILLKASRVFPKCKGCKFKREDSYNVEELRLIPQISIGHATDELVTRAAFHVGHGIAANCAYEIEALSTSNPLDNHATLLAFKSQAVTNDLDNFTPKYDLSIFQPINWTLEALKAKLDDIYEDLEQNVTRIYQRKDLHIFYDLAWHTVLYLQFQGSTIKGWGDVLVIGDSGQGKSECSSQLSRHYQCGERVDTKRASVAGIVGGVQESANRWFITWGTIPLNDRRLVILEEIKGMDPSSLTKMTDMRSSGVAEIIKIERAKTTARTRLVWISNPRSDNKLSAYNYGVDAVRELIGALEDIRRFDMVMAVASGEVPINIVNAARESKVPHQYTSDYCADLIGWAWSRTESQIIIDKDAEDEILAVASRMGGVYSSSCPIVEPSDQRLKVARLSAACAARTFSSDDGVALVIRKCHVQFVEEFLNRIYKSKTLGYYDFSVAQKGDTFMEPEIKEEVSKYLRDDVPHARETVAGLLDADLIRVEDIINMTEWPQDTSNEFIGWMIRKGCIKRHRKGGYRKTSVFIDILKELDRSGGLSSDTFRDKLQNSEL